MFKASPVITTAANRHAVRTAAQTFGKVYDAKDEMKVLVETKAVKELSKSANDIALEVLTDTKAAHTGNMYDN